MPFLICPPRGNDIWQFIVDKLVQLSFKIPTEELSLPSINFYRRTHPSKTLGEGTSSRMLTLPLPNLNASGPRPMVSLFLISVHHPERGGILKPFGEMFIS